MKNPKGRIFFVFVILSIWEAAFFVGCKSDQEMPETAKKPNLVFISIDTLRADRLGCYGYKDIETPNIDAVARNGILFSQAVSQVPITLPSHCSIFTGLNPLAHNVRENGTFRLDDSEITLAEILKENGYATAAVIGGFPLDSRFALDQGFDFYDDNFSRKGLKLDRNRIWQGHEVSAFERRAAHVVESALDWLSSHRKSSFFIFIHLFDPHASYSPPSPFSEKYSNRPYDGEVAYVDHCLGRLLKKLKKWRLTEQTLTVITSDHGESLGEHGYVGHGKKLYEPSMWIPLIISFPSGLPGNKVVRNLVRSTDIMPTLLEILEIGPVKHLQGGSLVSGILEGGRDISHPASYGETFMPRLRSGEPALMSYRTERWKYIRHVRDKEIIKEELFDLMNDAGELKDISEADTSKTREMASLLDEIISNDRILAGNKKTALKMDEETQKKLRSLGYIK